MLVAYRREFYASTNIYGVGNSNCRIFTNCAFQCTPIYTANYGLGAAICKLLIILSSHDVWLQAFKMFTLLYGMVCWRSGQAMDIWRLAFPQAGVGCRVPPDLPSPDTSRVVQIRRGKNQKNRLSKQENLV